MKEDKRAFRDFNLKLKLQNNYDNVITIEVQDEYNNEEQYTSKQISDLCKQISEKINNMRLVLRKAVKCPNCGIHIDQDDKIPDKFYCSECKCSVTMRFQE